MFAVKGNRNKVERIVVIVLFVIALLILMVSLGLLLFT